jgi:hypothetical protein
MTYIDKKQPVMITGATGYVAGWSAMPVGPNQLVENLFFCDQKISL